MPICRHQCRARLLQILVQMICSLVAVRLSAAEWPNYRHQRRAVRHVPQTMGKLVAIGLSVPPTECPTCKHWPRAVFVQTLDEQVPGCIDLNSCALTKEQAGGQWFST